MSEGVRRVVAGLDEQGRSAVLIDDRVTAADVGARLLWRVESLPADNSGQRDAGGAPLSMDLMRGNGCSFMVSEIPPNSGEPFMHATDTLDQTVVLKGQIELILDTGSVTLGPGSCVVVRGVMHGWRVVGDETVVLVSSNVPSTPVGAGATI